MPLVILEYKAYSSPAQFIAGDEVIRTAQFICNKALRYGMENRGGGKYDLSQYCAVLAAEFPFAHKLNAAANRAWSAIAHFYANIKRGKRGPRGYPQFKKHSRSVEYKTPGWKLWRIGHASPSPMVTASGPLSSRGLGT